MNLLRNGDFSRGLYEWTGAGTISWLLGYPRLGCVALGASQSIAQERGVSEEAPYTLHYFYRLGSAAILRVSYGDIYQTHSGAPENVWHEGVMVFAPEAGGGNESVTFLNNGATSYVDSVTLISGGLPLTRAAAVSVVAAALGDLATDAGLSATAAVTGPEGDYSAAVDEALRAIGAVNQWGDPDVTAVTAAQVNDVLEGVKSAMLQRLRADYALQTDVTLGPRSESRSQIAASLDAMLAGAGSDRRPKMGRLYHAAWRR